MTVQMQTARPVSSQANLHHLLPQTLLFGRFLTLSTIAKGVFEVFQARDLQTSRIVAVKVLRRKGGYDDAKWNKLCRHFEQESVITQLAQHPNAVRCEGFFQEPDVQCLVLEYLDAVTLRYWLGRCQPSASQFLYILTELCKVLGHLHGMGLIHRDLKPENIMLTRDNRVVLIDFGIAFDMTIHPADVEPGIVRGTPGYLAPEQLRCAPFSAATDLYALGAIMFEMLVGHPLFEAEEMDEIITLQVKHKIPSLRGSLPNPKDRKWRRIARATRRCLKKRPSSRYASTGELWKALTDIKPPLSSKHEDAWA